MTIARFVPLDGPGSVFRLPDHVIDLTWIVAVTNVQAERRAAIAIDREGLVPYVPMEIRTIVRQHRTMVAVTPLMPRYLFIGFDPECQGVYQLRSVDGVESLVRFDGQVVTVPQTAVEEIAAREMAGEFDRTATEALSRSRRRYRTGEPVKAAHGPFSGLHGHVLRAFKSGQVDVLLALLGRHVRTRFHDTDLTRMCLPDTITHHPLQVLHFCNPLQRVSFRRLPSKPGF